MIIFYPPSRPHKGTAVRADKGWCMMESHTNRSGDGRIGYSGKLYDQDGEMFADFIQDGLCRFGESHLKSSL